MLAQPRSLPDVTSVESLNRKVNHQRGYKMAINSHEWKHVLGRWTIEIIIQDLQEAHSSASSQALAQRPTSYKGKAWYVT